MQICFSAVLTGFGEKFRTQNMSTSQGLPYDFSSIMHFRHNAFSRDSSKSTLIPHNATIPKITLGSSATATDLDFLHLNILYCGGMEPKLLLCLHLVVCTSCNSMLKSHT